MAIETAGEVAVNLLARYDKLERQLAQADRVVDRRLGNMEARGSAFASRFTGALAGVSVLALSREFLKLADASKSIDAQLRLATATFGTFGQAQADVERLASSTRSGLGETATLYGNMLRATQALGGSQTDAARAAETFSKALKIGGADANATASATLQFGQALASGALRGDEFNSIAEASPRILKLLADSLGVPQGALRKMAEEGKLTADVLQRAFTDRKFTDGIDAEFAQLPVTFDQAMTKVYNAAILTFGAFDRGGQFSTALANFVTDGADGFAELEHKAEQLGINIAADLDGLREAFKPLVDGALSAFGIIDDRAEQSGAYIKSFLSTVDTVANAFIGLQRFNNQAENALIRGGIVNKSFVGGERPIPEWSNLAGAYQNRRDSSEAAAQRRLFEQRIRDGNLELMNSGRDRRNGTPTPTPTPTGTRTRGPSAATRERQAEAARQSELRDTQQFANELDALNADMLRAKQATASAAEDVAKFEVQQIEAARMSANRNYQDAVELESDPARKALKQARANQLIALNNQVAAESANAVRLREEERVRADKVFGLRGSLENDRALAGAEADLAQTASERRQAYQRIFDIETQIERGKLDEELAQAQIAKDTARIARARADIAAFEERRPKEQQRLSRDTAGPLAQYKDGLTRDVGDMNDALEDLAAQGIRSVEDGLGDVISGTRSVSEAFSDMRKSILADLAKVLVKKAILALFGVRGEGSQAADFFAGVEAGQFADGGKIVGPGTGRSDSILAMLSGGKGAIRVSNGEFIVNERATRQNLPLLEAINSGRMRGYADGGRVQPLTMAQARPLSMPTLSTASTRSPPATVIHAPQFNLRGAIVNTELFAEMERISNASAAAAGSAAYKQALRDSPGYIRQSQRQGAPKTI